MVSEHWQEILVFVFLHNVQNTYNRAHKLVEKYQVEGSSGGGGGGEYPLQDGFGWTNGVTLRLLDMWCPKKSVCNNASDITGAGYSGSYY